MRLFLQALANGIVNGVLYAMLAIGFGLVWRSLRVFHIAYGGLFVVSAYCFYLLNMRAGLPPTVALLLTIGFATVIGWLCEVALYRPFARKGASGGAVLIASLGVHMAMENVVAIVFGSELQTVSRGLTRTYQIGLLTLTEIQMLQFVVGTVVVVALWCLVRKMHSFKALWAMGDQPDLIPALGLPVNRLRTMALILSSALVALPASLICLDTGTDPHLGMGYLLVAIVAVLVGGVNSYVGWVAGAMVLALLQSLVIWKFSARWVDLLSFALLVSMLLLRPQGLVSPHKRVEELA